SSCCCRWRAWSRPSGPSPASIVAGVSMQQAAPRLVPLIAPPRERFAVSLARFVALSFETRDLLGLPRLQRLQLALDRIALGLELARLLGMTQPRLLQRGLGRVHPVALRRRSGLRLLPGLARFVRLCPRRLFPPTGPQRLELRSQVATRYLDHLARPFERGRHQLGIGDLLGDAAREKVGICPPCLERRFPAGRGDVSVVKTRRRAEDLQ